MPGGGRPERTVATAPQSQQRRLARPALLSLQAIALPPRLIQLGQDRRVMDVVAAVKQPGDPISIDVQGGHLLPEPITDLRMGLLDLGGGQLAHEQKHQLLLLAVAERPLKAAGPIRPAGRWVAHGSVR